MPPNISVIIPLRPIQIHPSGNGMVAIRPDPEGFKASVQLDEHYLHLPGGWMLPYEDLGEVRHRPGTGLVIGGASRTQNRWVLCALPETAFAEPGGAERLYAEIRRRLGLLPDGDILQAELERPNLGLRLRTGPLPFLAVGLGLLMILVWYALDNIGFGDSRLAALLLGAAVPDLVQAGELHRLFTAGLVHLSGWKLVLILSGFVFLASVAERLWGIWRLALVLLVVNLAGFGTASLTDGAHLVQGGSVALTGLGAALWVQLARMGTVPRSGAFLVGGVALAFLMLETWTLGPLHLPAFLAGLLCGLLPLPEPGHGASRERTIRVAGQVSLILMATAVVRAGYDGLIHPDRHLAAILGILAAAQPPDCYPLNDYVERIGYQPRTTPELHRAALHVAQHCVQHYPDNPWLRAGLSGAHYRLGQHQEAVAQMRIALRLAEQAGFERLDWFRNRLTAYEASRP